MASLQLLAESFVKADDKMPKLIDFLRNNPGASIVYVTTRKVRFGLPPYLLHLLSSIPLSEQFVLF